MAACVVSREELEKLRAVIDGAKDSNIAAARPQILAAEENLHSMVVDLDGVVTKVTARTLPLAAATPSRCPAL